MVDSFRIPPSATLVALFAATACSGEKVPAADSAATATTTAATPTLATPTLATPTLGAGEAMLPVRGGRIWYKTSGIGTGTPMVLLHGGPGAGSFYLKPFEALGDDRIVIRYDQLGAGKSDRLTDTTDRKSTRLNSSHPRLSRMPSSA